MPLRAFGARARAYATRVPGEIEAIVFDEFGFAPALDDAFERAFASMPFLAAPIISDRRSKVALDAVCEIVVMHTAYWKRRECLELVRERRFDFAGRTQAEHEAFTKKEKDSIGDVLLASDCIVTRSYAELVRLAELLDYRPIQSRRVVAPPAFPVPPFAPRRGAKSIVVWAPEFDAQQASLFAIALEELRRPVIIACGDPAGAQTLGLRASFVACTDSAALEPHLHEAAAIIDGSPDDPAAAIELAALGLPLAAAFSSGAYEYVDGLYLYDLWDFRSILGAALSALGGQDPRCRTPIPRPRDLITDPPRLGPPIVDDPPLVSVIIATLNRHGVLPRAIDSVARQTYPNIEVIVVNDGGAPVDSIVNHLPCLTLINNERPKGAIVATNDGLKIARGTYIVILSDDDYLFPTHISRLVYALERTGETAAAGMCAESYLTPGEDSYYDFIGTSIRLYRSTDPTVLRTIPTSMADSAMVVRRDAYDVIGDRNPLIPVYDDYEWELRFLDRFDFLWVSHLVTNMDSRLDVSNLSSAFSTDDRTGDLSRLWSQYPCPDRPDIDRAREAFLDLYRTGAPAQRYPLHRGVTRLDTPKRAVYRLR